MRTPCGREYFCEFQQYLLFTVKSGRCRTDVDVLALDRDEIYRYHLVIDESMCDS